MDAGVKLPAVVGFLELGPNREDVLLFGTVRRKSAAAHRLAVLAQQPGMKVVEARPLQSLAKVSASRCCRCTSHKSDSYQPMLSDSMHG